MSYMKQNFYEDQLLEAGHLNNIEDGIVDVEKALETKQPKGDYLTEHQSLENYATKDFVSQKITEASLGGSNESVDLSEYIKETEADNKYQPKGDYVTEDFVNQKIEDLEIPEGSDLSGYLLETEADNKYQPKGNYLTSSLSFAGKTLLVTGDSITEANFRSDINWHDYLKTWHNLAEVKNDGYSGSGLVKNNGIVYRIDTWDSKYGDFDMILIMGNMNDGTTGVTGKPEWLGSFADQNDSQKETSLYGALHYTLRTLTTRYPNTPIGWIISQPRSQVGDQGKC